MRHKEPLTYDNALSRAAALCSKCEQCSSDIRKKLATWGVSSADSQRIMERLEEMRFLDDERFARSYASDKLRFSGWGKAKIAKGLWSKRIPKTTIESALDNLDVEEYAGTAMRVMRNRVRLNPELLHSYEDRMKLLRFGVMRGFEVGIISKIISTLKQGEDDEEEDSRND